MLTSPDRLLAQKTGGAIKIQMYRSLMGGVDKDDAMRVTSPLIDKIESKLTPHQVKFEIGDSANLTSLKKLGTQLKNGEIQIGVVPGFEYSVLKKYHPKLETMAVTSRGDDISFQSHLLVCKTANIKSIDALRGTRLAEFSRTQLNNEFFLRQLDLDLKPNPTSKTLRGALFEVINGKADCVIVDVAAFRNFKDVQAGAANKLAIITSSDTFPAPALVGFPEKIDKLSPGLWNQFQRVLLEMDSTEEGKVTIEFWGFEKFKRSTDKYKKSLSDLATDESIEKSFAPESPDQSSPKK